MSEITNPPVDGDPVATSSARIVNPRLGAEATADNAASAAIENPSLDDRSSPTAGAITNPVLDLPSVAAGVGPTNPALDDPISDVELRFDAAIGESGAAAEIQPPLEEDLPAQPPPTTKKKAAAKRSSSK